MNGPEIVNKIEEHRSDISQLMGDLYSMYNPWDTEEQFISSGHLDLDVVSSPPSAGDLAAGEAVLGDGTGPNSRDEIFWSVDGSTVARVEADGVIN